MRDLKVGDVVWYRPEGYALVICCVIVEVDDWAKKQHHGGYTFYWVDEPVGFSLYEEDFFLKREDALKYLKINCGHLESLTLEEYRRKKAKILVDTSNMSKEEIDAAIETFIGLYPAKDEWFNLDLFINDFNHWN